MKKRLFMSNNTMFVKRYANRKLYANSCPITIKDIMEHLESGGSVKVQQLDSGDDVTVSVLGQALLTTLDDIDCDAFDTVVSAIKDKRGWRK